MRTSYGLNKRQRQEQQRDLPVELIGEILSRLEVAQYVIRASATCWKWQEAFRKHVHALSFNVDDDKHIYCDFPTNFLEMMITFVVLRARGLRKLSILMNDKHVFSASAVASWLLSTEDTLRELIFRVNTNPNVNLLYLCGREKLEALRLSHYSISWVGAKRFTSLTSLSLSNVSVKLQDLNLLLVLCPMMEYLVLDSLKYPAADGGGGTVKLDSPTLKSISVAELAGVSLILETKSIENLHIKNCSFGRFKLIGSRSLKHLIISDAFAGSLHIGETDNLQTFELCEKMACWLALIPRVVKSSKLKRLQLWVPSVPPHTEVSFEKMAVCWPELKHLSIACNLEISAMKYDFGGSSCLENLVVLEIKWVSLNEGFWQWADEVLKRCPNVKKLIIQGDVSSSKDGENFCELLAKHNQSMVALMGRYPHLDVRLKYK